MPTFIPRLALLLLALATTVSSGAFASEPARLSLNENPFGPSPLALTAIQQELGQIARYSGAEAQTLIALAAEREGVAPEQILLGELLTPLGLHLSLQGGPGGEFIYSIPGYPALVDAAALVGGIVVGVPLNAKLENDLPAITARINAHTRAIFLINPHNPSGTVSGDAQFKAFLRAASRQALVIVDEAYLEFSDDFAARTAVGLTREGENVMVFRTFAKAYGLAGLPMGYAIAPRHIAEQLRAQGMEAHAHDRLALAAASASLRDPDYLPRIHTAVATERALWNEFFRRHRIEHTESQGNFVYFNARRPASEVAAALRGKGIETGRSFPPYDTWVRLSIGLPEENAHARAAVRAVLFGED